MKKTNKQVLIAIGISGIMLTQSLFGDGVSNMGATNSMDNFIKSYTYSSTFNDVDNKQIVWAKPYIIKSYEYGLMLGVAPTTFSPKGNFTIGEAITVSSRIYSLYSGYAISDVEGSTGYNWYKKYRVYAEANKIIGVGQYRNLNRAATRAEMVDILYNSLPQSELIKINKIETIPQIGNYANDRIRKYYEAGILTGIDTKGTFKGATTIQRGEVSTIINRVILKSDRIRKDIVDDKEYKPDGDAMTDKEAMAWVSNFLDKTVEVYASLNMPLNEKQLEVMEKIRENPYNYPNTLGPAYDMMKEVGVEGASRSCASIIDSLITVEGDEDKLLAPIL